MLTYLFIRMSNIVTKVLNNLKTNATNKVALYHSWELYYALVNSVWIEVWMFDTCSQTHDSKPRSHITADGLSFMFTSQYQCVILFKSLTWLHFKAGVYRKSDKKRKHFVGTCTMSVNVTRHSCTPKGVAAIYL